ncbi:MAG: hypothetical protein F6K65_35220 [Moorea sp. SIO3C2]|nr:hypothetical protein [Moorena sp. SIO3C2]
MGETPKTALHRYSLLPTPYSLFPFLDNTDIVSGKIPSKCHRCRQLLQFRFT